jgi:23S rRNA pseudouridine2604 synthase
MNIGLKGLPIGDWRDLTESEMKTIYSMLEKSSAEDKKKTASKPISKKANSSKHHGSSQTHKPKNGSRSNSGKRVNKRGKR